ncbi:DUF3618 domain-containing protein [Streptomyces sp. NPDC008313]|uniref:DUF3618 domain-containing protein n=1 Tax=Streptomyces sp. NPDC008313 TaxID=3364826 RepID=UPI0036EFFE72
MTQHRRGAHHAGTMGPHSAGAHSETAHDTGAHLAAGDGDAHASGAKGPDELRRQIAETRTQLGDTVEELAAKADVKARAKVRAAELRHRADEKKARLRGRASHAGHAVQDKAVHAGQVVQHNVPEPVRSGAGSAVRAGRRNPRPVVVAGAGVLLAVCLVVRRRHMHH